MWIHICPPHAASAQVYLPSPMAGGRACYNDQFELICWYPEVTAPGRYLVPSPGWKANGSLLTLDGTTYRKQMINDTATKLIVTVSDAFSDVAYNCFLMLADIQLNEESTQQYMFVCSYYGFSLSNYGLVVLYYNWSVLR